MPTNHENRGMRFVRSFPLAIAVVGVAAVMSVGCAGSGGMAEAQGPGFGHASTPGGATNGTRGSMDAAANGASFREVAPILNRDCVVCHGSPRKDAGLDLSDWHLLMRGSDAGEAVIPFEPSRSLLVEMATKRRGGAHPGELGADTLSVDELDILREWVAAGAPSVDGKIAFSGPRDFIYVANQGEASVSIIDAEVNVVARRVDLRKLGFSASAKPHHVAVASDGSYWYLSLIGENRVLKFDLENRLVGQAEFEVPGLLAIDDENGRLYAGRSMSAVNAPSRLGSIRTSDMMVDEVDVFIPRPHALAVAGGGRFVLAASLAENTVAVVDTTTQETELFRLGGTPQVLVQFAVAPDGRTMVAGGQLTGELHFFDISGLPVLAEKGLLSTGLGPWHPVYSHDGRYVYVPNKNANTVTIVDATSQSVSKVVSGAGLAEPHGSALSPDGLYVYVSNNNVKGEYTPRHDLGDNANVGTVAVIDTRSNEIVKVLEVGKYAAGVGSRHPR